jgi:hypothetical protein
MKVIIYKFTSTFNNLRVILNLFQDDAEVVDAAENRSIRSFKHDG